MTKPALPFWDKDDTDSTEPPTAKQNGGANAGLPEGAQYINWLFNTIWKWLRGLSGSYADIVVGSSAQVTSKDATHDVDTFVAAIANGDHVHFLKGQTHTLGQSEDITESDVTITFGADAILDDGTNFTLTFSGDRIQVGPGQFTGFTSADIILSGADGKLIANGIPNASLVVSDDWYIELNNSVLSGVGSIVLPDSDNTLGVYHLGRVLLIDPSSTRVQTLPSTSVLEGDVIKIRNLSSTVKITIEGSDTVDYLSFQDGYIELMSKQDTPTTGGHWKIIFASGGAAPAFHAEGVSDNGLTVETKVTMDSEDFDTNGNYDPDTEYRFSPTVPGLYHFSGQIRLANVTAHDKCWLTIKQNGSTIHFVQVDNNETSVWLVFTLYVQITTIATYYEVWVDSDDASFDIVGGPDYTKWGAHWIGANP